MQIGLKEPLTPIAFAKQLARRVTSGASALRCGRVKVKSKFKTKTVNNKENPARCSVFGTVFYVCSRT